MKASRGADRVKLAFARITGYPIKPRGVQLVLPPSGDTLTVDLSYRGREYGTHVWEANAPLDYPPPEGIQLRIGFLPPHTTIIFHGEVNYPVV